MIFHKFLSCNSWLLNRRGCVEPRRSWEEWCFKFEWAHFDQFFRIGFRNIPFFRNCKSIPTFLMSVVANHNSSIFVVDVLQTTTKITRWFLELFLVAFKTRLLLRKSIVTIFACLNSNYTTAQWNFWLLHFVE